jgi:hypothetical protein
MSSRRKGSLEDEGEPLRINNPLLGVTTQNTRILKNLVLLSSSSHNFLVLKKIVLPVFYCFFYSNGCRVKKNLILFEHASLSVV